MSIPRKGSRRIRVGDVEYAWHIRKHPTRLQAVADRSMRLAIQARAPDARCVLVVDIVASRPDNALSPHQTAVKPAIVRAIVARALAAGWRPTGDDASFALRHALIRDQP